MQLAERLLDACHRFGAGVALVDRIWVHDDGSVGEGTAMGATITYAELASEAKAIARGLEARGLARSEPVLVAVSNRAADVVGFVGVWTAGGCVVPVHRELPRERAEALIRRTGARFAVNGLESSGMGSRACPPASHWVSGTGVSACGRAGEGVPSVPEMLRDAAWIVFTSGTTGEPKGVVHADSVYARKLDMIAATLALDTGGEVELALQLTFSFGQWVCLTGLLHGATIGLHERFRAPDIAGRLANGVARVALVPTMVRALRAHDPRLGSREFEGALMLGGEPLPASLAEWLRAAFPRAALWDIYGSTETATCDFFVRPGDYPAAAGTIGRPGEGIECRLRPPDGELQIRTPFAMRGYFEDVERTGAAFDEGWFRTGDLARRDEAGRMVLVGRRGDIINRGGNKVAPLALEAVFAKHPDVRDALAVGVPDERRGEAIRLHVVPGDGARIDAPALREWARAHLARYELPDAISFGTDLPSGATGKADRGALRALVVQGRLDDALGDRR